MPNGLPDNGGTAAASAEAGKIERVSGPLEICTRRALHGTVDPIKWKGERLWIVALNGEVKWKDDKFAALEREILIEVKQ